MTDDRIFIDESYIRGGLVIPSEWLEESVQKDREQKVKNFVKLQEAKKVDILAKKHKFSKRETSSKVRPEDVKPKRNADGTFFIPIEWKVPRESKSEALRKTILSTYNKLRRTIQFLEAKKDPKHSKALAWHREISKELLKLL